MACLPESDARGECLGFDTGTGIFDFNEVDTEPHKWQMHTPRDRARIRGQLFP
jgi:hypothetical protein